MSPRHRPQDFLPASSTLLLQRRSTAVAREHPLQTWISALANGLFQRPSMRTLLVRWRSF